jgi:hypothetical protein
MKIVSKDFLVARGKKVDLDKWPTVAGSLRSSKEEYKKLLGEHIEKLSSLQQLHYASNRYALLLIFQGMDSAGKDGAIRHVMSGVNPQGCEVYSFKEPSAEELEHDFLWRTTRRLPERGRIGIFNRSYYEEVLVVRVHPEMLRGERLTEEARDDKAIWRDRYQSIICRMKSSGSVFSSASTIAKRIGNSASRIFMKGSSGSNICGPMRLACMRPAPATHRGMLCPRMTRRMRA